MYNTEYYFIDIVYYIILYIKLKSYRKSKLYKGGFKHSFINNII